MAAYSVRFTENFAGNLESIREFLERAPASVEVTMRLRALKKRAGGGMEIRELIAGDYLILYAIRRTSVFLLAIRHHLQLSFDLRGHWF
jgi:hypothetical protein